MYNNYRYKPDGEPQTPQQLQQQQQQHSMPTCPFFPLGFLKEQMMNNLAEAVKNGAAHIRDPLGGTNSTLFV